MRLFRRVTDDTKRNFFDQDIREFHIAKSAGRLEELTHYRFMDEWRSIQGGAVLGFSGIMLAAILVMIYAEAGTFIGIEKAHWQTAGVIVFGAGIAFLCAAIPAMHSFNAGQHLITGDDERALLGGWAMSLKLREKWIRRALLLAMLGTGLVTVATVWNVTLKLGLWV